MKLNFSSGTLEIIKDKDRIIISISAREQQTLRVNSVSLTEAQFGDLCQELELPVRSIKLNE